MISHFITHGLFFALITNAYLFLTMLFTSPRVWGYNDYSQAIKNKVPAQTAQEKRLGLLIGIPWFIFILGFPIFSTHVLKSKLGGEIPYWAAFANIFIMAQLTTLVDLVVLDWLVVSRITPKFVIIPGSEAADYKDFSHHYKAHARAAIVLTLLSLLLAAIVWHF